jgi:phosphatidylglycerol:prolipoprotein diacylglycerol transferase
VPSLDDPIAFHVLDLPIRWYGLFILAGLLAGIAVARWLAVRRGLDPEFLLDAAPLVILAAVAGARFYYIVLRQDYFRANPDELVGLQLQGLTIHGALVAGIAAFALYCIRRGESILTWADVVIAAVPIGQAIGRWGNWANQEAFGTPSSLPWAVEIEPARRPAEHAGAETFHPTFLYEGLANLLVAAVLIWIVLRIPVAPRLRTGDALAAYLILYGLVRLAVESVRTDSLKIGPWPAAYWLSVALIVAGLSLAFALRRRPVAARSVHRVHEPGKAG